jgi:hypothetical protein
MEFIRRFLLHVLPSGFMKVRHFGFMSHNCALALKEIRRLIIIRRKDLALLLADPRPEPPPPEQFKPFCRKCGAMLLFQFAILPPRLCREGPR